MQIVRNTVTLVAGLILSASVYANKDKDDKSNNEKNPKSEPVVTGVVVDANTKKPVAGVTISTTGKGNNKTGAEREMVTDANGVFKFASFPIGEIMLEFEKKGYRTFKKDAVVVKEGITTKINIELTTDDEDYDHPLSRMNM